MAIMNCLGTVKADTHHEVSFLEKPAPFIVQQCAVGLQRVGYRSILREMLLQIDDPLEEIDFQQRRFSPLPDELDNRRRL